MHSMVHIFLFALQNGKCGKSHAEFRISWIPPPPFLSPSESCAKKSEHTHTSFSLPPPKGEDFWRSETQYSCDRPFSSLFRSQSAFFFARRAHTLQIRSQNRSLSSISPGTTEERRKPTTKLVFFYGDFFFARNCEILEARSWSVFRRLDAFCINEIVPRKKKLFFEKWFATLIFSFGNQFSSSLSGDHRQSRKF